MGMNTVILILNDHLDAIERDPEFGAEVARAISLHGSYTYPRITGQTKVISVSHADDYQIVVVHGNLGREVSDRLSPMIRRALEDAFRGAIGGYAAQGLPHGHDGDCPSLFGGECKCPYGVDR